jgi:hypothetical protein
MLFPARLIGTGNDTEHDLVANLTQLAPASLSPKMKTVRGEWLNSTAVTGRAQTIVPPAPKVQVDHRRLSADGRKSRGRKQRKERRGRKQRKELAVDEMMKWSGYRLGDILKFWRQAFLSWWGTGPFQTFKSYTGLKGHIGNPTVCRRWPTSLGCRFLKITKSRVPSKTKRDRKKYKDRRKRERIFTDILGETLRGQGTDIPSSDTVVVHVRLSDVLTRDNCWELPPCRYNSKKWGLYANPFSWYDTVVQEIRNISAILGGCVFKVVVVGYSYHLHKHRNRKVVSVRRSIEYRTRLVQYFKDHGFDATARPGHLPDEDFLYMTKTKFFVPGGGGLV